MSSINIDRSITLSRTIISFDRHPTTRAIKRCPRPLLHLRHFVCPSTTIPSPNTSPMSCKPKKEKLCPSLGAARCDTWRRGTRPTTPLVWSSRGAVRMIGYYHSECRRIRARGLAKPRIARCSFHNGAHDTWIVTKGAVRLWAGDQSRILLPGDFAYVPPVSPARFCSVDDTRH